MRNALLLIMKLSFKLQIKSVPLLKRLFIASPASTREVFEKPVFFPRRKINTAVKKAPQKAEIGSRYMDAGKKAPHTITKKLAPAFTPIIFGLANGF